MRHFLLTTLLALALLACPALAQDEQPGDDDSLDIPAGPVAIVTLTDGTTIEALDFIKLGRYYFYLSGKLNGRSSTVISFTRMSDLKLWKSINFKDPYNFTVLTQKGKQFYFPDSYFYLGSDSNTTYTFIGIDPNTYEEGPVTVDKSMVMSIAFQ